MAAFIQALLATLAPVLGQLLLEWLGDLLKSTAKEQGLRRTGDDEADHAVLLKAARASLPRRMIFRRALLSAILDAGPTPSLAGRRAIKAAAE